MVVLGGRAIKANVELHDVRWVVGSTIEEKYETLRKQWFGLPEGLHIDSYKKITHVDSYRVNLNNLEENNIKSEEFVKRIDRKKNLWFVNIGGYDPSSMQEKHEFGLVVASSSLEAKNMAKTKWLSGCKKKHRDDIDSLKMIIGCYDCQLIKKIDNWEIEITLENNFIEESNHPDWYGYKRIDKI